MIKFELNRLTDYSDEAIINEIRRVATTLNISPLTIAAFEKESKVKVRAIHKRFNGWKEALEVAGLDHLYSGQAVTKNMREQKNRNVSDDELLNELRRVSNVVGRKDISTRDLIKYGSVHRGTYSNRFGSWEKAISLAGLNIRTSGATRSIPMEDLFKNLLTVWTYYGRQPHYSEMNETPSRIKAKNYHNRFGTWRKALLSFIDFMERDSEEASNDAISESTSLTVNLESNKQISVRKQEDRRDIPLGIRFKVMYRDHFKCLLCGDNPPASPGLILHVDHITPWSKGGKTQIDNLRTLCANCNIGRGNHYSD